MAQKRHPINMLDSFSLHMQDSGDTYNSYEGRTFDECIEEPTCLRIWRNLEAQHSESTEQKRLSILWKGFNISWVSLNITIAIRMLKTMSSMIIA